jgi:hypothetical protein
MMADLLTKKTQAPATQESFQAASLLFRAQELGLQALALFDRAGGICIFLEDDPVDLTGNEILLHLNARGVAKKVGTRWVFQMVQGGAGAL